MWSVIWLIMAVRSDTVKPLLPLLYLWRLLGVLPFSHVRAQGVIIRSSRLSYAISLLFCIAVTIAHVGRKLFALFFGEIDVNFVQIAEPICGIILISQVVIFSRHSCRILQNTFRSLGQVNLYFFNMYVFIVFIYFEYEKLV